MFAIPGGGGVKPDQRRYYHGANGNKRLSPWNRIHECAGQGLPYELTDMGTIIEGNIDQLLAVAKALHESTFSNGAKRVYTVIKIDDRRDKEVHLGQKTGSVKERL